jgi:hypothetical protein
MYIGMITTENTTKRIYIRARDAEMRGLVNFDKFQIIKQYLDLACRCGKADKFERDSDDGGGCVSWELSLETADVIYAALMVLFMRAQFNIDEDVFKATERWVENA